MSKKALAKMRRLLGVEGGRLLNVGRFNPPVHRGVDVFAKPGSRVFVPRRCRLEIVRSTFDPDHYKGQAMGWLTICGVRYGFVAAHLSGAADLGVYTEGEQYGQVSGRVDFTPHCHIALAKDHIPPPGDVDPVKVWRECLAREPYEMEDSKANE